MKASSFKHRVLLVGTGLAVTAALVACGGGGDDFVAGSEVPKGATRSNSDLIGFMLELQGGTNETSEPILLGDVVLASDETSEPTTLAN